MYFSVKTDPGVVASSFKKDDPVFIDPMKLLPMERFTIQGRNLAEAAEAAEVAVVAEVVVAEVAVAVAEAGAVEVSDLCDMYFFPSQKEPTNLV